MQESLIEKTWTIQRWYKYRLGHAEFTHDPRMDRGGYLTEAAAQAEANQLDVGTGSDMYYRYHIV